MQGVADFEEGGVRPVRRTDEKSAQRNRRVFQKALRLSGGDAGIGTVIVNGFKILGTHRKPGNVIIVV